MKRLNKTEKNLQKVWDDIDLACGYLDIAFTDLNMMVNIPDNIKESLDSIDFSAIVELKNEVEELIEQLKKEK